MNEGIGGHITGPEYGAIEVHPEQALFHGPDSDSFAVYRAGDSGGNAIDGEQSQLFAFEVADLNTVVEGCEEDPASGF